MKTLVVYDSLYGNTERIAQAIGQALPGDVEVKRVGDVNPSALQACDLLIAGSPTHGGRASEATRTLLAGLPANSLQGVQVAAFDTRLTNKWARIMGFAAGRIAGKLKALGGTLAAAPEGFFVTGGEGPLAEGEVERATVWAGTVAKGAGLAD